MYRDKYIYNILFDFLIGALLINDKLFLVCSKYGMNMLLSFDAPLMRPIQLLAYTIKPMVTMLNFIKIIITPFKGT